MAQNQSSRRRFATVVLSGMAVLSVPAKARAAAQKSAFPRRAFEIPPAGGKVGHLSLELNETALFIYDKCDGQRDAANIAHALAEHYVVDLPAAKADVMSCLTQLRAMGLLL